MNDMQSAQIDYSHVDPVFSARPADSGIKDLLDGGDPIIMDINPAKETRSSNLDKALRLAGFGYRVFPCRETTTVDPETGKKREVKTPYTEHGFKDGTTDAVTICKWWTLVYPQAFIGPPTGKESEIVVADLDMKDGKDWHVSAEKAGLDLPETHTVITRSGGEHRVLSISALRGENHIHLKHVQASCRERRDRHRCAWRRRLCHRLG